MARKKRRKKKGPLWWDKRNRYWCKKVAGKTLRFGPRDSTEATALKEYEDYQASQGAYNAGNCSITKLTTEFLANRERKLNSGDLAQVTFDDYVTICDRIIDVLGDDTDVESLRGPDFAKLRADFVSTTNSPKSVLNLVNRARTVFNFAVKADLIDGRVRFGTEFDRPSAKSVRAATSEKMFTAAQVRKILKGAPQPLHAMAMLGVNVGYGNTDVLSLEQKQLDLKRGWANARRSKTATFRRAHLWPETITSLQEALEERPRSSSVYSHLVFVNRNGHPFTTIQIARRFRKLLEEVGCYERGVTFYTFRHVFETIGGESLDQVAVDFVMGHERGDMASNYRHGVSDKRLRVVSETVRKWVFKSRRAKGC